MKSLFIAEGHLLVVRMRAKGLDPAPLVRPLAEFGCPARVQVETLGLDAAEGSCWSSVDAAFIARVLRELGTNKYWIERQVNWWTS